MIRVYIQDKRADGRKNLTLEWIDPATGKRRSQSAGTSKRRGAEIAAADLERRLNAQIPTGDGSLLWESFVELYELQHLTSLRISTFQRASGALRVFTTEAKPRFLSDVSTAVLSRYATRLREKGRSEPTIASHLTHIRAALRWAVSYGHLSTAPQIPRIHRGTVARAKGRPLSDSEFVQMLRSVRSVVGKTAAKSWRRLLIGLWLSGLRLNEALLLRWNDRSSGLWIDTSGKFPLLGVSARSEKGGKDRLLPLTPDFCGWVMKRKAGPVVFPLVKERHRDTIRLQHVSKVITAIGKQSGVKVSDSKFASAHDLRRTFGLRWSSRLMPAELRELMRHSDISTTMTYYVLTNAETFAEKLWKQHTAKHTADDR